MYNAEWYKKQGGCFGLEDIASVRGAELVAELNQIEGKRRLTSKVSMVPLYNSRR